MYIGITLQSTPVFLTMIISSIVITLTADKIKSIYLPMFITGMLTSYVDFLTAPIITLGVPLSIYFLIIQKKREIKLKEDIKILIIASINWGLGYVLTWFTKWVIVDICYDKNLIKTALEQVLYRTVYVFEKGFFDTVYETIYIIKWNIVYIFVGSLIITIIRAIFNRKKLKKIKIRLQEIFPYFVIMLMPFAWYFVLEEHSAKHIPFTYRALLLFLTSAAIIILKFSEKREDLKKEDMENFKEKIKNILPKRKEEKT